jgi:uncharacterized protein YjbJ (UPF0337 family)
MDKNVFGGAWNEFKGEVRKVWGKLTGDELEATHGDVESISGLIQQKYGHKKDEVSQKLTEMKDRFAEKTKSSLRESNANDVNRDTLN